MNQLLKWRPRLSPRRPGQSLVELALVLPLLAVLLLGLVEFGMVLYAHVQVSNAAREAARSASLYRTTRYPLDTNGNVLKCGGVDGWTLQQTVDQAVVRYFTSGGCPQTSGRIENTTLGRLEPSATWVATYSATLQSDGGMPAAGADGSVTLTYPYQMIIISQLIPWLDDPVTITKSVAFQFQP